MTNNLVRTLLILSIGLTAAADDATLHWTNGDSLSGTLLKADDSTLTWRSPMFTEPLQIRLSQLASVNFPGIQAAAADEAAFRIQMRNGDLLNGRLLSMTDATMSFESARFGRFDVARDQILSLQCAANSGMIFSGLRGLKDWQPAFKRSVGGGGAGGGFFAIAAVNGEAAETPQEKVDDSIWFEQPDGSLFTKKSDAAIFLPLTLPEKFELEFEVRSTKPVSFLMAIGRNPKYSLRIETWVDVLVAAKQSFTQLKTIGEKDLAIHLYAFVDQAANTMQVFSDSGEKLGEISTNGHKTEMDGLMFRNGDFDLAIQRLRVSHWDGKSPRIVSGEDSRIELNDGTLHFGKVEGFDAEAGTLALKVSEESLSVPITNVISLMISGQSSGVDSERGGAWLSWIDGGFVSGSLVSIADGQTVIQTPYAQSHLQCAMSDLVNIGLIRVAGADVDRQVRQAMDEELRLLVDKLGPDHPEVEKLKAEIKDSEDAVAKDVPTETIEPDHLFHEHGSLRGRLVVEGAADVPIQWTPLGGLNASTLQGVENARFVRAADVTHLSENPELLAAFPDVIYLKNNDVLPCRIEACTEDGIQFTSPLTEVRVIYSRTHLRG